MTTKHTPGPWFVTPYDGYKQTTLATVAHVGDYVVGIETGRVGGNYRDGLHGDDRADAALIAAAPELLEALKKEQEWRDREAAGELDDGWDYETMVGQYRRAAIAQAEGHQ